MSGTTTSSRVSPRSALPEVMDAEDMLYILYTSGTTAKPKGIVHTTGGYLTGAIDHAQLRVRHQAGRRVLVRSRHRLGDRPHLHRVRPAWPTTRPA